jgi:hypothetical protein
MTIETLSNVLLRAFKYTGPEIMHESGKTQILTNQVVDIHTDERGRPIITAEHATMQDMQGNAYDVNPDNIMALGTLCG